MKRFILIFVIVAIVVSFLVFPASAAWEDSNITVIDYLDYADTDHLYVVDGAKYVQITIPVDGALTAYVTDDGTVSFEYGRSNSLYLDSFAYAGGFDIHCSPINDFSSYSDTPRISEGFLIDRSKFISGTVVYFDWTMYLRNASYLTNTNTVFKQYCNYYGEADSKGYSYRTGRTALYELTTKPDFSKTYQRFQTIYYVDTSDTVGNVSNYISPMLKIENINVSKQDTSLAVGLNDIVMFVPINDELLNLAESQQNQKLLTAINEQLAEQGKTMDEVLEQQQQTNDKIDGIQDSIDGITGYEPEPELPEWQDSVDDYENVEQDAMENVQSGMDDADKVFDSVFTVLGDYVQSFAAVSILFNAFADIPFFSALLAVSLSLGIVAALLGIGIDAVRWSSRSSARSTRKARSG